MSLGKLTKDPAAVLPYRIDWSEWLEGDTIASSSWTVPTGLVKDSDSFDGTSASVVLSAGVDGQTHLVTNRITTAEGRLDERSFELFIKNL